MGIFYLLYYNKNAKKHFLLVVVFIYEYFYLLGKLYYELPNGFYISTHYQ